MSKKDETETKALKPKVGDDDLIEMLQAKADAGEIKTAASGLKAIRADGLRVAQKRVYVAFKSVVVPAPEAEAEDDDTISEDQDEAPVVEAEETESWDEEE